MIVKCLKCNKGSAKIEITTQGQIIWLDTSGVISGRKRFDKHWGFQCLCGNNTMMSDSEMKSNIVRGKMPTEGEMKKIKAEAASNPMKKVRKGSDVTLDTFLIQNANDQI